MSEDIKSKKIAAILVRGLVEVRQEVKDTLRMLNLQKKNACVILADNPVNRGMLKKCENYLTYGEVSDDVVKELQEKRDTYLYLKIAEFSYDNLLLYLSLRNVEYKEYVLKQAILETGYFTSLVFTANNNLFGMRHPRVRPTLSLGSNLRHAKYAHWTDSVEDYLLWREYHQHRIEECYYQFLQNVGYAEDIEYINKLKLINLKNMRDEI